MRQDAKKSYAVRPLITDYIVIVLGTAVYALSVDFFTAPNQIAPGGVTGISTLLHYLIGVPIGITSLILNIPLFIWGAIKNGFRFIIRTVIANRLRLRLFEGRQYRRDRYHRTQSAR